MTKKFCALLCMAALFAGVLAGCNKEDTGLTKVTLNEVAHSIFYAPMYVAIEKGYFEEEGIDLTLVNGNGADNVMTALIAGEADIGFMGSEASIYVYQEGSQNYAINFAQLTQRAGNFLVGREADADFTWEDLKGTTVLGGRAGGMPQMIFEYILKQNGIDPQKTDAHKGSACQYPLERPAQRLLAHLICCKSDQPCGCSLYPFNGTLHIWILIYCP